MKIETASWKRSVRAAAAMALIGASGLQAQTVQKSTLTLAGAERVIAAAKMEAKKLDDLRSPLRFLLGHTQLEKEIDHLAMTNSAAGGYLLTGIPHGQGNRVQRLSITVTAEGSITGIEIEEVDGAVTRFTFSDEQPNAPIAPGTFKFTPPPGVPVVDAMKPV